MNCIATHQALHAPLLSMQNTMTSKKILSHKALNALLPDLMLLNDNSTHVDPANAQKLSKSFVDLGLLARDVQAFTSCGASVSMSILHQPARLHPGNRGAMNRLTHNAVFTAHTRGALNTAAPAPRIIASSVAPAPARRLSQPLKGCKVVADRQRVKELKLDDMGSLRRLMEEYRKLKKSGKYNYDFSSDSDDEDLE